MRRTAFLRGSCASFCPLSDDCSLSRARFRLIGGAVVVTLVALASTYAFKSGFEAQVSHTVALLFLPFLGSSPPLLPHPTAQEKMAEATKDSFNKKAPKRPGTK